MTVNALTAAHLPTVSHKMPYATWLYMDNVMASAREGGTLRYNWPKKASECGQRILDLKTHKEEWNMIDTGNLSLQVCSTKCPQSAIDFWNAVGDMPLLSNFHLAIACAPALKWVQFGKTCDNINLKFLSGECYPLSQISRIFNRDVDSKNS